MPDLPANPIAGLYPQPPQQQQPQNALAMDPSHMVGMMSQMQQMELQRRQMAAHQAVGNAFQNAIGADGSFDPKAYALNVKNDPNAAYGGAEVGSAVLDARIKHTTNSQGQVNLWASQSKNAAEVAASLYGDPTPENLIKAKLKLAAMGLDPSVSNAWLQDAKTPAEIKKAAGIAANYGMGPAAATNPDTGTPDASGAQTQISRGARVMGPTQTVTGTPMGSEESAKEYNAAASRVANIGADLYPAQEALRAVQSLGPGGIGPGTEQRNKWASAAQSLSPKVAAWLGIDPDKVKNYDEFVKYTTQDAQRAAANLGGHTDMQLAATLSGNANAHISSLASEDVLKARIALRQMQQVVDMKAREAGPVGFNDARSSWGSKLDPRAFLWPSLSDDQRQHLKDTLSKDERRKFNESLKAAIDTKQIEW